jgi:hypothetical protein
MPDKRRCNSVIFLSRVRGIPCPLLALSCVRRGVKATCQGSRRRRIPPPGRAIAIISFGGPFASTQWKEPLRRVVARVGPLAESGATLGRDNVVGQRQDDRQQMDASEVLVSLCDRIVLDWSEPCLVVGWTRWLSVWHYGINC